MTRYCPLVWLTRFMRSNFYWYTTKWFKTVYALFEKWKWLVSFYLPLLCGKFCLFLNLNRIGRSCLRKSLFLWYIWYFCIFIVQDKLQLHAVSQFLALNYQFLCYNSSNELIMSKFMINHVIECRFISKFSINTIQPILSLKEAVMESNLFKMVDKS